MNILVVHEVSYLKKVVYEYQDFPERLAGLGHNVTVIDFDEELGWDVAPKRVSRTGNGEVTLASIPHSPRPILNVLTARLSYKRMLRERLKAKQVDIVFLYSVFVNGTNTIRLCKKFNVPVVYRVLDVYHKVRQNALIKLPLYFGEKTIYRNADRISLTNEKMRGYIHHMVGRGAVPPIDIHEHGVDTRHFARQPRDPVLCARYGITPAAKVLLFLGTTYSFCGVDQVIEGFDDLKRQCPDVKLLIVGSGELDPKIAEIAARKGLTSSVIQAGVKSYAELPAIMSLADVGLLPFANNDITRDIVPIKLLQYLALGMPVVATPLPDVVRILPDTRSGIRYCDIADARAFVALIGELLASDQRLAELGAAGLAYIHQHFSVEVQIRKIEQALTAAVAAKARGGVSEPAPRAATCCK